MLKIFICYRREDSAPSAGRLYDRVAAHFGNDNVFMDVDGIEPGENYFKVIRERVGAWDRGSMRQQRTRSVTESGS